MHVERDDCVAKFWLDPVRLQASTGFAAAELRKLETLVDAQANELRKAWDDFFASGTQTGSGPRRPRRR